jgi:hypothetical protein
MHGIWVWASYAPLGHGMGRLILSCLGWQPCSEEGKVDEYLLAQLEQARLCFLVQYVGCIRQ